MGRNRVPQCLPGRAHHWQVDKHNYGVCELCGVGHQFPWQPEDSFNRLISAEGHPIDIGAGPQRWKGEGGNREQMRINSKIRQRIYQERVAAGKE